MRTGGQGLTTPIHILAHPTHDDEGKGVSGAITGGRGGESRMIVDSDDNEDDEDFVPGRAHVKSEKPATKKTRTGKKERPKNLNSGKIYATQQLLH